MEMNELFYRDAYVKEFDGVVVSCEKMKDGYGIVLDDTAFYPEGGGQPGDTGYLNDVKVTDTKRIEDLVVHLCKESIAVGTVVHGRIDWDRRFDNMQAHTGEHLFSGLVHHLYGYDNVGFHMGEVIQVDFNGPLSWQDVNKVELLANQAIWRNEPVIIQYPDEKTLSELDYRSKKELQGKIRIVCVGKEDVCACCGTHVQSTGEIGLFKVLTCEKHKGGTRLTMLAGSKAYAYVSMLFEQGQKISHLLSAPMEQLASSVEKLQKEKTAADGKLQQYVRDNLLQKVQNARVENGLMILFGEGVSRNDLRHCAKQALLQEEVKTIAICSKEDNSSYSYLIMSECLPLRTLGKQLNQLLDGRGGGSDELIQGTFLKEQEEIVTVLKEVLHG
ncbi:MAG: alanyl-tRNA editing protein [Lactimicrobium sp.]|jgi:alanyl-tRNA synthetase|uniref:alanyl-tRNA editing protein n=1 Tax=Lactimicrobium sp. TaxID=2563780 RepID=UPI002F35BEFC